MIKLLCWDLAQKTGEVSFDGTCFDWRLIDMVKSAKSQQLISRIADFDTGHMLYAAMTEFESAILRQRPDAICFEAPILRGATTISTTRRLQGLAGIVELLGVRHNIPTYDVEITTVKQTLSGFGHAGKSFQVAACRAMGFEIDDDNVADAMGICGYALSRFDRTQFRKWTELQLNAAWSMNQNEAREAYKKKLALKRAKKKAA